MSVQRFGKESRPFSEAIRSSDIKDRRKFMAFIFSSPDSPLAEFVEVPVIKKLAGMFAADRNPPRRAWHAIAHQIFREGGKPENRDQGRLRNSCYFRAEMAADTLGRPKRRDCYELAGRYFKINLDNSHYIGCDSEAIDKLFAKLRSGEIPFEQFRREKREQERLAKVRCEEAWRAMADLFARAKAGASGVAPEGTSA